MATEAAAEHSAWSAIWTFPSILASAFVIAWGAEGAQFLISQGLALAILAWLQTLPEFAVEAVIAWPAGKDPTQTHIAIANFTGSLRLLVGLGGPMLYFVAAGFGWKRAGRRFVTLGTDGAMLLEGNRLHHVPAFAVDAVDTTGAGDVFRAAFIYAMLQSHRPADVLRFAAAAAALSCTREGAMTSVPALSDVQRLLRAEV